VANRPHGPWLFGAFPDLVLGCGLGYGLVFLIFSIGGAPLRVAQPLFVVPLLSVLLSGPHYGATLLRVYERREDRRAYALFSVWATLLIIGLFTLSIYNGVVASLFFTVFITWSPWHYTGQNYGLSLMFLRRGGTTVTPLAKRLLYTSFVCSFLITFLVIHTLPEASSFNPNPIDYESKIVGRPLGIPHGASEIVLAGVTFTYVVCLIGSFGLLAKSGSWRALAPAASIVVTQALWFSLPFSFLFWGVKSGLDPLDSGVPAQYAFWAAIGHAVQYQFVTTYYARASANWRGYRVYLGKCLAAGAAVWTLPAIVFAPDLFGEREFTNGLGALVAAAVNIHHFILDGAIWKLRNSRIADILIRSNRQESTGSPETTRRWPARALWAACGTAAVIRIGMVELEHFEFPVSLRYADLSRSESILDVLAWFGRDDSHRRVVLADAFSARGDSEGAEAQFHRSLALQPSVAAWTGVALRRSERDDWQGVADAYQASRSLWTDSPSPQLSELAMRSYYRTQQPDRARAVLDDVASGGGARGRDYAAMGGIARDASDFPTAIEAYREALRLDPDRYSASNNLAWILATASEPSLRDPTEAIALAKRAVEGVDPPDPNYLDTLATAYAAGGRFADAIATASRALELANEQGNEPFARAARESLDRYRRAARSSPTPDEADSNPGP
jgi:tetratricopeptide (TPR) repeat protein